MEAAICRTSGLGTKDEDWRLRGLEGTDAKVEGTKAAALVDAEISSVECVGGEKSGGRRLGGEVEGGEADGGEGDGDAGVEGIGTVGTG